MLVQIFPPNLHGVVREALAAAGHHAGTIILLSLLGLAWFSSGLFSTAGFALNQIHGWPNRSFWRQRLLGLTLMMVLSAVTGFAVGIDLVVRLVGLPGWFALLGIWLALTSLIVYLYRRAPSRTLRIGQLWPGSAAAAAIIVLAGYLLTVTTAVTFLLSADTRFFASVFALAAWVYLIAQAILFGAFLNKFLVDVRISKAARRTTVVAEPLTLGQTNLPS